MRRIIITALVALTALGGIASADGNRRGHWDRNGWHGRGGVRYEGRVERPVVRYQVRPHVRIVRRPIYVQRPVIRYRYYNYAQRPSL